MRESRGVGDVARGLKAGRFLHLAAPCRGSLTRSAMEVLVWLQRGCHPQRGKQWPSQLHSNDAVVVENPMHGDICMSTPAPASGSCAERLNHGGPSATPILTPQNGHEAAASLEVTRMIA